MAIEIREEMPARMYIGRRAGFHGGQFLWNDEPVMRSLALRSFPPPLPRFFFYYLLTMTARDISSFMRHLIGNSSQESVVRGGAEGKKNPSALRRQRASFVRDPSLLAFVNAVYFIRDTASPIYFLNDLVAVTTNAS